MKLLETVIRVQDRTLKLFKRDGQIAMYEVYGPQGLLFGYEVVVVQILPEAEIFGRSHPLRESTPSNEDWGRRAGAISRAI